jgi:heat shock protein 90kDa beta
LTLITQVLSGSEFSNASTWVHFNAEGNINFKSILYLPEDIPASYRYGNIETVAGAMRLYVRKVLIGDEFDVMPKYLGFIRGIIDSEDLPLNVNRETLQETKILQVIKKKVVRKAIDLISQFARESEEEAEKAKGEKDEEGNDVVPKNKYIEWYKKFSPNIKLGMIDDEPNRAKLAKLVRYPTSKSNGELISLSQYVENMKDWQKEIYVIGGTNIEEIEKSPFIDAFREKDVEVVYMTDALDEYLVQNVRDFNGKKFVQATSESVKFKDEDEDLAKRREKVYKKKFTPLTKWLKKLYGNTVLRVQVAKRSLGSVPAIVSSSEYGNSANMERIMRAQAFQHGVDPSGMMSMRVFEINPRHPIIIKLLEGCPPENEKEGDEAFQVSQETVDAAMMIHDMAMLAGGFPINDFKGHNRRLAKVLKEKMGLESLKLEPEIDPPIEDDDAPDVDDLTGGLNMEDFAQFGDGMNILNADDLKNMNFDELNLDKDEL